MLQNIQKVVLHIILLQKRGEILHLYVFYGRFGGHFEFDL